MHLPTTADLVTIRPSPAALFRFFYVRLLPLHVCYRYDVVCLFVNDVANGEVLKNLGMFGVGMVALR